MFQADTSCPDADLLAATFMNLTFTQQKNGVRNETIGHGRSGHPSLCLVQCLASRVLALRNQGAAPTQTLNAFRPSPDAPFRFITPASIAARFRSVLHLYRYLHVQAQPVMTGLSAAMLQRGTFRLTPP